MKYCNEAEIASSHTYFYVNRKPDAFCRNWNEFNYKISNTLKTFSYLHFIRMFISVFWSGFIKYFEHKNSSFFCGCNEHRLYTKFYCKIAKIITRILESIIIPFLVTPLSLFRILLFYILLHELNMFSKYPRIIVIHFLRASRKFISVLTHI